MKRYLITLLVALLCCVGSFFAGRFTGPAQVETRIEWRDLLVEDLTRGLATKKQEQRTTRRNVVTTITPDAGTVIVDTSVEVIGSTETRDETSSEKRTVDHGVERVEVVTNRPDWRVSLQVGASLRPPALPITGPLVLGAAVEARVAKTPVWIGAWGNTVGAAGGQVSLEF